MTTSTARRARRGFTLIELVVVVLVMGILAAVAAPKMFDTATNAKVNTTRQSLMVVRDAIELYKANNGSYPTAPATDLKTLLKTAFPAAAINKNDATVKVLTTGTGVTPDGTTDWIYNSQDGTFAINSMTSTYSTIDCKRGSPLVLEI